jgi:hypothetical protein
MDFLELRHRKEEQLRRGSMTDKHHKHFVQDFLLSCWLHHFRRKVITTRHCDSCAAPNTTAPRTEPFRLLT